MIKKAVSLLLTAPFLMVFSDFSFANAAICPPPKSIDSRATDLNRSFKRDNDLRCQYNGLYAFTYHTIYDFFLTPLGQAYLDNKRIYESKTPEECESDRPLLVAYSTYEEASSATSFNAEGCSYGVSGPVIEGADGKFTVPANGGEPTGYPTLDGDTYLPETSETDASDTTNDFSTPEYLTALEGSTCSTSASCVNIGDTSYLVDWDSAPDYFSYVDANGTTYSKPSSGGGDDGSGDNNGGSDPTDPTDPGGDTGGGDSGGDTGGGDGSGNDGSGDGSGGGSSGGGSGGGSSVPDFEFDESGIIEAIGSAGRSNRNAIDALSNDVTDAISQQTEDFIFISNNASDNLNLQIEHQTDDLTDVLNDQSDDLTNALEDQTGTITNSLDALGTTFTDALKGLGLGSGDDDSGDGDGDGEGEDGEGDGLLGGISKLLNKMVDKLASRFTEDLGDGDDLFDSSGMDDTLDGVAAQEEQYSDDVNALMDEIGEGATSGIAEQITSRLPSLPSGGCVPFQFGPMDISCRPFNIIKSWLTWAIYFYSVISIINTFFRSEQRTA